MIADVRSNTCVNNKLMPRGDQAAPPSRSGPGMVALLALLLLGCATSGPLPRHPATPSREVWVSASVAVSGDGSARRPFKSLGEAIYPGPARVRLASGLYVGPFVLPPGTFLEGSGQVVLY